MSLDHYIEIEDFKQSEMKFGTLKRLFRYIVHQRRLFAVGCFFILLATITTLLEPRLFGYAIDEAIVPKKWELLKTITTLFLGVICLRVCAMIAQAYIFEMLGQRVMQTLRLELFSHLQALPVSIYDRNPVGRLITRVTGDVSSMSEMFAAGFVTMIGNFLIVVGTLSWLMILNFKLGLIAGSVFPVLIFFSISFSRKLRVAYQSARALLSSLNAFLAENILGVKVLHLFNRQKIHLKRFSDVNDAYADAQVSSVKVFAYFQPTITWCSGTAIALVIWYGGGMALQNSSGNSHGMTIGVLVTYFSYVLAMFQPVREMVDKWTVFLSGMTSAERIFSILDWETEMSIETAHRTNSDPVRLKGRITFENVWFAYDKEHWILKDFSVEMNPGSRIGIVGHTGAGKTTIISLLLRFYEPQRGRILIDGQDIRSFDKRSLRAAIGIVQQDVFLFSGSTRENITLWKESDPLEKVASKELDERGSNLSMGERQMIAFDRALFSNPSIWILDEATSNVDSTSEKKLVETLNKEALGKTVILIAHRLATVRSADQILVLHKGTLVESGSHSALMKRQGYYSKLYQYQLAVPEPV